MTQRSVFESAVLGEFASSAFIWLIPALLLLPLYLALLAISVVATEGALLEIVLKAKGGIHSALGVLLLLAAVALGVVVVQHASTADDWITGVFMVLATGGVGLFLSHRELRKIADGR